MFCPVVALAAFSWWPADEPRIVIALDASTLKKRFTVLCISVVYRGCAIPVAWKIVGAEEKGSWQPIWISLLSHLQASVPSTWTVLVLTDRGLYAPWPISAHCQMRMASLSASQQARQCSPFEGTGISESRIGRSDSGKPVVWEAATVSAKRRADGGVHCLRDGMKGTRRSG